MASTYLDLLSKMQEQGLEALKQTQSAYLESLTTARKMIETLPAPPQLPTIEGLPTVAELTELNAQFLDRVVEQQKSYAKALADVFAPIAAAKV
jgi:hypothetical protein